MLEFLKRSVEKTFDLICAIIFVIGMVVIELYQSVVEFFGLIFGRKQ